MRVFKIFFNRKKKANKEGGNRNGGAATIGMRHNTNESETNSFNDSNLGVALGTGLIGLGDKNKDDETLMHKHGMSAMQALNEIMFLKYLELISQAYMGGDQAKSGFDLEKEIRVLKISIERQKRARLNGRV